MLVLPPRPDALLLDLDGTLSASGPVVVRGIVRTLTALGEPVPSEAELYRWLGPPLEDSFAALPGVDAARTAEAVRHYRAQYDPLEPDLFDGIVDVLSAVHAEGIPMAVATTKPQHFAEQVVEGKGLGDLVGAVRGWQPDAGRLTKGDCIRDALEALGGPEQPVMVGDRVHDVEGAAEHGVPCLGALWGYGGPGELSGAARLLERPEQMRYWA